MNIRKLGLAIGQKDRREHDAWREVGWFDFSGNCIGWGDISTIDLYNIAFEIGRDFFFIVPKGMFTIPPEDKLSEGNIDQQYMMDCAITVVTDKKIIDTTSVGPTDESKVIAGVERTMVSREALEDTIAGIIKSRPAPAQVVHQSAPQLSL